MLYNHFKEYKTEKYKNLIPSREFILEYLVKCPRPINYKEIAIKLNINNAEQTKALRRRLRAMERDGQLVFTRHQNYVIPEHLNFLKGIVIGHRSGHGFLRVKGRSDDLYLSPTQMKNCIHGDQVLVQPLGIDYKGRCEARIIRILVPKTGCIIGRYFTNTRTGGFVVPSDSRLSFNILIPSEKTMSAKAGFIVLVELIQRPTYRNKAVGRIIKVIGANMTTHIVIDMTLRTYDIPYTWPKIVRKEIENLKEEIPESAKIGRVDLRNLPLVTIDSEDANDFDDAVYCERKSDGGWRLLVVIADVSYYVRPYTSIDNEARNRGTSIYFPSQVIPMLPEILSNKLCSLNPQVDRLCMVCEMDITSSGILMNYKFYEAIMHSHARLTYTKVWHILQGNLDLCKQYTSLVKHINELYSLYKMLALARENRGGISFKSKEARLILNSKDRIEHIEYTHRNDAHKLIEECMILANISAAHFVEKTKEPILFRVHEKPTDEAITAFRSILSEFGLKLSDSIHPEPRDYARLLNFIVGRPDEAILQTMILRSMKQATYDLENRGHFGLALKSYAHFTSPIRRYPDLSLHRVIKYLIAREQGFNGNYTNTGGYHYSIEEIFHLGQHCSMVERRADHAVREVVDWLKCDFMLNQIGNVFHGIISSVTNFGFFVHLNELFIDGLIHVSSLKDDYYYFDHVRRCLIGEFNGRIYRIGDYVEICLEEVNMDERKIIFALASKKCNLYDSKETIYK